MTRHRPDQFVHRAMYAQVLEDRDRLKQALAKERAPAPTLRVYDDALDEARQAMTAIALEAGNIAHDLKHGVGPLTHECCAALQREVRRLNDILSRGVAERSKAEQTAEQRSKPDET